MSRYLTSSATAKGRDPLVGGTFIDLVRGGKIVEHWSEMSFSQFMQALSAE
jgi:hypothetical protein